MKPVTGRFEKWLEYEVLKESQYIFYQYSRRKMIDCTCSHCKSEYQLERSIPRHNKEYVCPICKRKSIFKAKENQDIFLIIQKQLKLKKHQIESYYVILKLENLMLRMVRENIHYLIMKTIGLYFRKNSIFITRFIAVWLIRMYGKRNI